MVALLGVNMWWPFLEVTSEMTSHAAAESELSEELEKLNTLAAAVTDSAKTVLEQASKEQATGNRE